MKTLNKFVAEEIDRLRRFEEFWKAHQTEAPELFPKMMPDGEWDEQLRCFEE